MDCNTARELLPLYFDGELDRVTSREFEAHLDTCAACRDALIGLDGLRRSLRGDAPRFTAPATLRARIETEAAARGVATGRLSRPPWRSFGLAASWALAFALGAGTLALFKQPDAPATASAQLTRDLFASHWRALAAASPIDVVSTDQHTVKPWFEGRTAVAPTVKDFAAEGYALIGGRIDYAGTERVPVLVYRHGKHLIDVFVLPAVAGAMEGEMARSQGYVLESTTLGGQPAAIISDMDQGELTRFRDLLSGAQSAGN